MIADVVREKIEYWKTYRQEMEYRLYWQNDHAAQYSDRMPKGYSDYRAKWSRTFLSDPSLLHMDIGTVDNCNLRCPMCNRTRRFGFSKQIMPREIFSKAIQDAVSAGCRAIRLDAQNEPLMDERVREFARYARECGILEVFLNTNGHLLNQTDVKGLIEDQSLNRINVSVDSLDPSDYAKIRKGARLERVLANLSSILEMRKAQNAYFPIVRITKCRWEYGDGAHAAVSSFVEASKGYCDEVGMGMVNDFMATREIFEVVDIQAVLRSVGPCSDPWKRLSVDPHGNVYGCCLQVPGTLLGNILSHSLGDLFTSGRIHQIREAMSAGKLDRLPSCMDCYAVKVTPYGMEQIIR